MGCNCSNSSLSCCPDQEYAQDKVCSPWTGEVPEGATGDIDMTVFANNINQNIVVSGYLQYDAGPDNIDFQIVNANEEVIGAPISLSPGTSSSFTLRRFSELQILLPEEGAGLYTGELCLTVRYPLP